MLLCALVLAQTLDFTGYVAARGSNASEPRGRLEAGERRDDFAALAHAGIDWTPTGWLTLHASGIARRDDPGLAEAYADLHKELAFDEVRVRAGFFFLPTSRENKDDNWASPYTIHFSALNSWIGEEVRPLGVDLQYRHTMESGHTLTGGATAFRANDTMGTLLAWRGWTVGDRLSTWGEVRPLPPLESLQFPDGPFYKQRDEGTTPFTSDLDGRTGWSARVRYAVPQRGNLQYTYVDNAGDRALHPPDSTDAEYAWDTRFHLLGAEAGDPDRLVLAAEYLLGETYMGLRPLPDSSFVNARFWAAYLLVSAKRGRNRLTARYDLFTTEDQDRSALGENNDESGRAWTFAWMFDVTGALRGTVEFTQLTGKREPVQRIDERSVTAEARYRF